MVFFFFFQCDAMEVFWVVASRLLLALGAELYKIQGCLHVALVVVVPLPNGVIGITQHA